MATRQEIQERKATLLRELRERCASGALRAGTLAPSKRQLALEFEVSATIVAQVMGQLIEEQLFHTVARSGTYVGPPRPLSRALYVLLCGQEPAIIRAGFEDRIAHLGGAVLAMNPDQTESCRATGHFPEAAGVMEWGARLGADEWRRLCGGRVPALACYATLEGEAEGRDSVAFDDEDGGRQATAHLLHLGHRAIAFLGLHQADASATEASATEASATNANANEADATNASATEASGLEWSRLRAQGWREALGEAGLRRDDLLLLAQRATSPVSDPDHVEAARAGAKLLAARRDVDAVVTANDRAAQALLEELRAAQVPTRHWPAIVSFDADPDLQSESLTSLRLPWEDAGKTLADLLWARSQNELPATPQHRLVKMRLIPRLTCQPHWTGLGTNALAGEELVAGLVPSAPALPTPAYDGAPVNNAPFVGAVTVSAEPLAAAPADAETVVML